MHNHIGFTGTQIGMSEAQKIDLHKLLDQLWQYPSVFHHGDCIGADEQAAKIAYTHGYILHCHPPKDNKKRAFTKSNTIMAVPKPDLERNHDIVEQSSVLLAAPKDDTREELRSGTWATIRYAKKLGRGVLILAR